MKYRVIQASPEHTGSTVLANALTEIFDKGNAVFADDVSISNENIVTKTHNIDLKYWKEKYSKFDLYFFGSHRKDHRMISDKYTCWENVVIFDYEELLETNNYSVLDICDNIYKKVSNLIKGIHISSVEDMANRINNMNEVYKKIKEKPFSYYDKYYHIHGSHRNRGK